MIVLICHILEFQANMAATPVKTKSSTASLGQSTTYQGLRVATETVLEALRHVGIHGAIGGSLALWIEGFDIGRQPHDGDIVILDNDNALSARRVRQALCMAGCENLPSETAMRQQLHVGHTDFALGLYDLEIQVPATKVSRALPHAKRPALRLLQHTRSSVALVDGVQIIRSQNVAVWKAIYGREKDKLDFKALIESTNAAGEPAITNANELVDLARAIAGDDAAAWVNELLFKKDRWYAAY